MKKLTLLTLALGLMFATSAAQAAGPGQFSRQTPSEGIEARPTTPGVQIKTRTPGLRATPQPAIARHTPQRQSPVEKAQSGKEIYIYGSLIYSDTWNIDYRPYGIYNMPLSSPNDIQPVEVNSVLNANAGGVYYDGKFCFVNYFETFGAITAYYYIYDANSWERISSNRVANTSIATDLTFDPVSRTIYGCFLNSTSDGYVFGSMEASTGAMTAISNLNAPFFFIAASPAGEIFGVQSDGFLYKINKNTGSWTKIGDTGVQPYSSQSATFDPKTGKLYWAACTRTTAGLYEVDTTDGHATLLQQFDGIREFGGLYIPDPEASDKAPDAVNDLTVEYIPTTAADLKVSFTMPTSDYAGDPLTGEIDYIIIVDGTDKSIGSAMAGEEVSFTLPNSKTGEVSVGIATSNDFGRGPTRSVKLWVGKDSPKAVTDIKYTLSGNDVVNLSWTAPTKGIHGGYINPEKLSYKIVRRPDNKVVADGIKDTFYSDNTGASRLSYFYYDITSYCDGLTGETAGSGKVVAGSPMTTPYLEQFNTAADMELFTIIDANKDGRTWARDYLPRAYCTYSATNTMDDWLITPPIQLSNDRLYKLSFTTYASDFTELYNVYIGAEATVEGMTTELIGTSSVKGSTPRTVTATIRVDESKPYYIGFHKISPPDRASLFIDDISVTDDILLTAPAAPSDLSITPGANGTLTATISFKAPTTDVGGAPLTEINYIYLYRGEQIIKNFKASEISLGGTITYTDNAPVQGMNTYSVAAVNNTGTGIASTATAFIGIDAPGLPQNVRAIEIDGKAHISWEAPASGKNGGYYDPDNLKYLVAAPGSNGDMVVYVSDYTGTSYDATVELQSQQESKYFYVFAESTGGLSEGMYTNSIIMGTPYGLPFYESFAGSYPSQDWHIEVPATGYWQSGDFGVAPSTDAQDLDGGLVSFYPENAGDEGFIYTGKLSTVNSENPTLEFYYYNKRGSQDRLNIKVTNNGVDWQTAKTINFSDQNIGNGWKYCSVSLKQYATSGFIQVGFYATSVDGITAFHIDNIAIRQIYDHDLEATNIFAPIKLGVGNTAGINVQITNTGSMTSGDYDVVLYRDGNEVARQSGTGLEARQSRTFGFQQTPDQSFGEQAVYYATIDYAADQFNSNNTTKSVTIQITQPECPPVNDLTAEVVNNKVTLNWSTPAYRTYCDDFDSYMPFAITGFSSWTTIDIDAKETVGVQDYSWNYANEPQAWIVFDPVSLDIATESDGTPTMFAPHSGNQMMVSFAVSDGQNDDWLISPQLNGKAQTVSFYIKSVTDYYGSEEYQFLTSKNSSIDINTFEVKTEDHEVPTEWTKVSIDLEEGTTYFAIRNIGQSRFALCIDDVTFAPASLSSTELEGFNVYCNNQQLNDTPITENTYTYEGILDNQTYIFTVTAVYNHGESVPSNTAIISTSGIDKPENAGTQVYGRQACITIIPDSDIPFAVYTPDGRTIAQGTTDGTTQIQAQPGFYVVVTGSTAHKVRVY